MKSSATEIYKTIQRKAGKKGGIATFKKYGREHMARLGKRSGRLRRKAKLSVKT